ncbi:trypsin 5G1-like [Schistocerca piceifrons]|uniref:trypsin 5G1-like n=1 Tax=Schistocerca piceifrons TaxID=274613 RepID=UPI001F5E574B|nr:trypsin 5G1-like [Schistocerca piceifrons]
MPNYDCAGYGVIICDKEKHKSPSDHNWLPEAVAHGNQYTTSHNQEVCHAPPPPAANYGLKVSGSILGTNERAVILASDNYDPPGGIAACKRDSGDPLVSGSTQVGIVSWGSSRCEATPGVFANVGNLRSWIRSASGV